MEASRNGTYTGQRPAIVPGITEVSTLLSRDLTIAPFGYFVK